MLGVNAERLNVVRFIHLSLKYNLVFFCEKIARTRTRKKILGPYIL